MKLQALRWTCVLLVVTGTVSWVSLMAQQMDTADQSPATARPADKGWPRTFEKTGNQLVMYQPQVQQWQDYSKISFRAALALTPAGEKEPVYGVIDVKANTDVDHDARLVMMSGFAVDVRFVDVPKDKAAALEQLAKEVLPQRQFIEVSLDRVLAYMKGGKAQIAGVKLDMTPPTIYRSESPAILVVFVGPPQFKPIKDTSLTFAANTNWDILKDQAASQYYLRDGDSWLTAPDPVKGPWTAAQSLPDSFSTLPNDANWQDVRMHIPGVPATQAPKVFVSTAPAELIVTTGAPAFTPIAGTALTYVNNPTLPVFQNTTDNAYYYLVAGRWFRAASLDGPWAAASTDLPDEFGKIPQDSPVGFVLASVPKSSQAEDAVLLASVPHKATIDIDKAKVDVTYDGDPKFAPIQDTSLQYAVNSPQQVILTDGQYYCCYQGVWFSAPAATGPWAVCTSVPAAIYTIPPTSPLYNVTYVKVYDSTPSTVVVGYTGGYTGEYVAPTGVLMFGAGVVAGDALAQDNGWYSCSPAYYSYGCAAHYNYGYGGYYGGAAAYYGPYGGAGHAAAYNPATGTYARGAYAYGPAGAAAVHQAYNPSTGNWAQHAGATNGYQSWGHTSADVNGTAVQAGHKSGPMGSTGWAETSSGKSVEAARGPEGNTVAKTGSGDVYAGKDGNVYQKTDTGWQSHSSSGWQNSSSAEAHNQLSQDSRARSYGNEQANRSSQYRGGGGRGGGGRR